jgi:hypothetical protein
MKAYGEVDVPIHIFLNSTLAGGERSASRPGRYTPGEKAPGTHLIGGWVGPRAGLDGVKKRKFLNYQDSNSDSSVVQPVASRKTDYAIPAPITNCGLINFRQGFMRWKVKTFEEAVSDCCRNVYNACSTLNGQSRRPLLVTTTIISHPQLIITIMAVVTLLSMFLLLSLLLLLLLLLLVVLRC